MKISIGIDIGQSVDPTAYCVSQQMWRKRKPDDPLYERNPLVDHYIIRRLGRLKLGTPYPAIARELEKLCRDTEERVRAGSLVNKHGEIHADDAAMIDVFMDATGVGKPVVDILRLAGVRVVGVYIYNGDRRSEEKDDKTGEYFIKLGKGFMVSRLQALLQTGRIHLPDIPEAKALARELTSYSIKVDRAAVDKYGAFRTGEHDDLVTALGLAVQKPATQAVATASQPALSGMVVPGWAGGDVVQETRHPMPYNDRQRAWGQATGLTRDSGMPIHHGQDRIIRGG